MLPTTTTMGRIRASASLPLEALQHRIDACEVTSASPGVRVASAMLVQTWLRKFEGATSETAQLAATALGAGYATGRAMLDTSATRSVVPADAANALLTRLRDWDYVGVYRAAGESVAWLRRHFSVLVAARLSQQASRAALRMAYALFAAGLGLALAEGEYAPSDSAKEGARA